MKATVQSKPNLKRSLLWHARVWNLWRLIKPHPRVSIKVGYWWSTPACKTSYRCLLSPRADARNAENYISKRLDFKLFVGEHAHRSPQGKGAVQLIFRAQPASAAAHGKRFWYPLHSISTCVFISLSMVCVNDYVTMYMHSIVSLRENAINLARLTTNPETLLACGSFCLSFFSFCLILMDLQLRSLTLFTSKVFLTISSPEIYVLVSFTYCLSVCPLSPI